MKYNLCIALALCCTVLAKSQKSIVMQHGDLNRTGWNNQEYLLNKSNVRPGSFGKIFTYPVDDDIFAQPLVVLNLNIPNKGIRNVLFVATVNNTVYAFDADTPLNPYWKINLTPAHSRPVFHKEITGRCGDKYNDFPGNIGIVGTPVIDTSSKTMYLVTRSYDSAAKKFEQHFHALDITTGQQRINSPQIITASVSGNGDGNQNGIISFDALHENQRSGLLLLNGIVYVCWASHCDWAPYHGWIIGYDKNTLEKKIIYNTTPEGEGGGIWMSGGAPSADANGNIFVAVGNGTVGLNGNPSNLTNRGESILKLNSTDSSLVIKDFFTPKNYPNLETKDLDVGSLQVMLIPNSKVAVTGCKDGEVFIINKNKMGKYHADSNWIIQTYSFDSASKMHATFSYYKGKSSENVYVWSENVPLTSFPFIRGESKFNLDSVSQSNIPGSTASNGAFMSVSSNGSADSTAILWASHIISGYYTATDDKPGILRAIDATDITKELWNSGIDSVNNVGVYSKFVCPTVVNGKVYLPTFSNKVVVYGLIGGTSNTCNTGNIAFKKPAFASSTSGSNLPSYVTDGKLNTGWLSDISDPQYIYVDLGATYNICKIALNWANTNSVDFKIQVSDDALSWTDVISIVKNFYTQNNLLVNAKGRYVRMYGTKSKHAKGYALKEFEVYGAQDLSQPQYVSTFAK